MARTLFFLEGLVALALALLLPFIAKDFVLALAFPLAFVLLMPASAALAAHPWSEIRAALTAAFSGKPPLVAPREIQVLLAELGGHFRSATVIGALVAVVGALPKLGTKERPEAWLGLGAWLALYGVLAMLGTRILALAAAGMTADPAGASPVAAAGIEEFRKRFGISAREWEVAASIASGASYKETADRLFISLSTVKAHLSSVYRKTGARDKIDLVLLLRREGC
jgi:DNA-binding CsgD family transcriptional regulator